MGSFPSMSKVVPATDTDKDIEHEFRQLEGEQSLTENQREGDVEFCSLDNFLPHCSKRLVGLPEPISRKWKKSTDEINSQIDYTNSIRNAPMYKEENIRVLQWNVLSQSKYA